MNPTVDLPLLHSGKVRDVYDAGDGRLLMVTSDRISAFDVVMEEPIPDKGRVLTAMTAFWFERFADLVPGHLISTGAGDLAEVLGGVVPADLVGRTMLCRRAEMLPIECIVRGYITGSAWSEYRRQGTVSGMDVGKGLVEGQKFSEPLFTPTTKAEVGHDENMSKQEVLDMVGADMARQLEETSKAVFKWAHDYARERDIILADTKMEFGIIDGRLTLIDELLTPDSSRFWGLDEYQPGQPQQDG